MDTKYTVRFLNGPVKDRIIRFLDVPERYELDGVVYEHRHLRLSDDKANMGVAFHFYVLEGTSCVHELYQLVYEGKEKEV